MKENQKFQLRKKRPKTPSEIGACQQLNANKLSSKKYLQKRQPTQEKSGNLHKKKPKDHFSKSKMEIGFNLQ